MLLYVIGVLVVLGYILLATQLTNVKRDMSGLCQLYKSDVAALGKIADTLETYILMVQELRKETDSTIQERANYSKELLQKASFANSASVIENLETLQEVVAFLNGRGRR